VRNKLVVVLVLVATGCVTGVGAYVFFYLAESLSNLTSISTVSILVFASLSTILPYIISRSVGFYSGGGTDIVVQSFHGGSKQFSPKRALGYYAISTISIGFGGSAGPEGPMIVYGAGVARAFSRLINAREEYTRKLLLAGAAAGFSAAFKAPLTGILYALEIPYKRDIEASAFLWSIPAAITAYAASQILIKPHIRVEPPRCYVTIDVNVILLSIVVGLVSAALALLIIAITSSVERFCRKQGILGPLASGIALAVLVFFFPEVRGFGYEVVNSVINNTTRLSALQLTTLALVKIIATALTIRGGGSGGVFLPTIFTGIVFGAGLAKTLNSLGVGACYELILELVVSSLLAATSKTLLASIALAVEMFGFVNVIPSLLASTTAYTVTLKWSLIRGQPVSRSEQ
jgi:CIC family chloride channel protein